MKWREKNYHDGDRRICSGFLFFPKEAMSLEDTTEFRWLEHATWEEEFCVDIVRGETYWLVRKWVDERELSTDL